MFLDDFHTFLLKHSGITGNVIKIMMAEMGEDPVFFEAWQSPSDPLFRTLSVVTAPVCLSILTVEFAVGALVIAIISLIELFIDGPETAKKSASMAGNCLMIMAVSLFAAFISPVINAADMLGGGVNAALDSCSSEEDYQEELNCGCF